MSSASQVRANAGRLRVTVVMPMYDVERFVLRALESALAQTLSDLEVVAVDDGSTDSTLSVVEKVSDPRLRILRQDHSGASAARNRAISGSESEYVAFLDADDYWREDKLEKQVALLDRRDDLDLVFSLCSIVDKESRQFAVPGKVPNGDLTYSQLLAENYIRNGSAVLVRRQALAEAGGFDPEFAACNDYEAWLRVAGLRTRNVGCVRERLTFYRRREGQITGNWRLLRSSFHQLLRKMEVMKPQETSRARPAAIRNMYRFFAVGAYESGDIADTFSLLARSFASGPIDFCLDPRSWLVAAGCLNRAVLGPKLYRYIERPALRAWACLNELRWPRYV